jgi:hypothetical protein
LRRKDVSAAEEYARAVLEDPQAVRSADHRQFARAGVMRAAGELSVDRFQGGGANTNERLFVAGRGVGEILEPGRLAKLMQDCALHSSAFLLPVLETKASL